MIRLATVSDVPTIVLLGEEMRAEGNYKSITYNPRKVYALIVSAIQSPYGLVLVEEREGKVVGVFLGQVVNYFFSDDMLAEEQVLFITKEHRGGTAAYRMIKEYIRWAEAMGVKEIAAGSTTGVNMECTRKLYEKAGFNTIGYLFKREV